jgi:initiation factor 1A
MVRNTGGNKAKGQARKHVTANKNSDKTLRESENELELYAQVEKVCGNGMYQVICLDNTTRLCHSSGKFKGRNKKDNFVSLGTWLLVGLRDYETINIKKMQNCDLLEVYNENEKDKLKMTVQKDWSKFIKNDDKNSFTTKEEKQSSESYDFANPKTLEYQELMLSELQKPSESRNFVTVDGEEINIDDI